MQSVGMIGLGQMGLPMATNLIASGYAVVGYRRGDSDDLVAAGGTPAASPREVAERCDVIFSCLPGAGALANVVSGPQGLASGPCEGRILVELSTLGTEDKRIQAEALAAVGGTMLDGAVSGFPRMVADRSAIVLLSGDRITFDAVAAPLSAISTKVFFMGAFGAALRTKLCANMLVAINMAAASETLAFGRKLGIDPLALVDALREGGGASLQFTARAGRMVTGDWHRVMGGIGMLMKDIRLIESKGEEVGFHSPLFATAGALYGEAVNAGHAEHDGAAVYAVSARRAGLDVPEHSESRTTAAN